MGGGAAGTNWAGVAGQAAGAVAPYLAPSNNLNEYQQNRQANIGILNDLSAGVARDQAFDPLRAFREMQSGQAMAAYLQRGGQVMGSGYGAAPGADIARSETGHFGNAAGIINALKNADTYSMRKDDTGQYVYDPMAFNAPDLAFARGRARDGGYSVGGENLNFGREGAEGEGIGDTVRSTASGALSGAGTGAGLGMTIGAAGGPIGIGAGAAIGALAGGVSGYFRGRGMDREGRVNRQANIGTMNEFAAEAAARQMKNPTAAFRAMVGGEAMAQRMERGGRESGPGFGNAGGTPVAYAPGGRTDSDAALIASLRNPETFSMRNEGGQFAFDPVGMNPLNLAYLDGGAREGGYSRAGDREPAYFGRNPTASPGRSQRRQQPRREDEQERLG